MLKEDHRCWAPLIAFGLAEPLDEIKLGYTDFVMEMRPDFPQHPFYQELFQMWGLDTPE